MDEACSINRWLEKKHPKFAELLHDNCADGFFRPGRSGITFLMPSGKTMDELVKLFKSSPMKAIQTLKALIVDADLHTGSDWEDNKADIPNRLRIRVKIKSVDKDKVTFENGATAVPMKGFKPREDRQSMSVWEYTGALPPTEGERANYTNVGLAKKGGKKKKRGGAPAVSILGLRHQLCREALDLLHAGRYEKENPYTACVTSYLSWMEKKHGDYCKQTLCPMLDNAPEVTFVILFGDAFSPQGRDEWYKETGGLCMHPNPSKKYIELLNTAASSTSALRDITREVRNRLRANVSPAELRSSMVTAYEQHAGEYSPAYKSNHKLKIVHDETRCLLGGRLPGAISTKNAEMFKGCMANAFEMQRSGDPGIIVTKSLQETDKVSRAAYYNGALAFFLSDCFLYAPYVADMSSGVPEQLKQMMSDPSQGGVVNAVPENQVTVSNLERGDAIIVEAYGFTRLMKGESSTRSVTHMISALNTMSMSDLDEKQTHELQEAVRRLSQKM